MQDLKELKINDLLSWELNNKDIIKLSEISNLKEEIFSKIDYNLSPYNMLEKSWINTTKKINAKIEEWLINLKWKKLKDILESYIVNDNILVLEAETNEKEKIRIYFQITYFTKNQKKSPVITPYNKLEFLKVEFNPEDLEYNPKLINGMLARNIAIDNNLVSISELNTKTKEYALWNRQVSLILWYSLEDYYYEFKVSILTTQNEEITIIFSIDENLLITWKETRKISENWNFWGALKILDRKNNSKKEVLEKLGIFNISDLEKFSKNKIIKILDSYFIKHPNIPDFDFYWDSYIVFDIETTWKKEDILSIKI